MGRDCDIDILVQIEAGIPPAIAQEAARRRQQDIDSDMAVLNKHRSIHGLLLDKDELVF